MLEVRNVKKIFYGRRLEDGCKKRKKFIKEPFNAVDDISFEVEEGRIVGILGPNGAGKTTLLRMIGGILTPDGGYVLVNGKNIRDDINFHKRNIGYLSGNTKLYGKLTGRELLSIFGRLYEMDDYAIENSIDSIIDIMDIGEFIDNRIEKMSTGQTQRISISRCLIHNPGIYILDEPTLGLDVISSQYVINFMKNEKNKGKTVLYSTHYMEEADALCDEIIFINNGKIIDRGTPLQIKKKSGADNLRDAFIILSKEGGEYYEIENSKADI